MELVAGFPPAGINFDSGQPQKKDALSDVLSGACGRIRTGDLLITSELLCQLSHTSINADGSIAYFTGAVNRFSGEESLFSAPPTSEVGTYRE